MDLTLTPEQELIRSSAREFVDGEIAPHVRDWDRDETMDRGIVAKLAEVGFLAGWELDTVSYCLVDGGARPGRLLRARNRLRQRGARRQDDPQVGHGGAEGGVDPRLGSGEVLGCYALTEPGRDPTRRRSRRPPSATATRGRSPARRSSSRSAPGPASRSCSRGQRRAAITCFLVPTDSPGFSAHQIKGKLGLRAQDTGELAPRRRAGPRRERARRGGRRHEGGPLGPGQRPDLARGRLRRHRPGLSRACLAYASERRQFGRPIASFQLVQELLAEIAVETDAARLLTWKAAPAADAGTGTRSSRRSRSTTQARPPSGAANAAVQVHGGYGYVDEFPVGKYLRDARVTTLYEGTSQIQKLIIGRQLTGENAFV